jgi:hypothetical protein
MDERKIRFGYGGFGYGDEEIRLERVRLEKKWGWVSEICVVVFCVERRNFGE